MVLYTQEAGNLLIRFYKDDPEHYRSILMASVNSSYNELKKQSLMLITVLSVEDSWMLETLLSMPLDDEGMRAVLSEAAALIRNERWRYTGKQIALHCLRIGASGDELTPLLFDRILDIDSDKDLIEKLLHSKDGYVSNQVIDYICGTEGCITGYLDAIFAYLKDCLTAKAYFLELDKLIKYVARAFQQGEDDAVIHHKCLNIWDELFLRFPLEMSSLSQSLEQ